MISPKPADTQNAKLTAAAPGQMTLAAGGSMQLIAAGSGETSGPISFTLDAYSGGVMYPILSGVEWKGPVVIDLAGLMLEASVPVHRDHDTTRPVGHATPSTDTGRLSATGAFSVPGSDADEIVAGARNGFPWRVSVGLSNMTLERIAAGRTVNVNGRDFDGPILIVRGAHLDELSFVTVPGDLDTSAAIAAARDSLTGSVSPVNTEVSTVKTFAQWLAENGHDFTTLTAEQLDQMHGEYMAAMEAADDAAEGATASAGSTDETATATAASATASRSSGSTATATPATDTTANALAASRAAMADEIERVDAIRAIGESIANPIQADGATLTAHAIRNGWTVAQTTLAARRAARPQGPAIHSTSPAQRCSVGALQAALMLRAGRAIDRVLSHSDYMPAWLSRPVNDPGRDAIMNAAHEFRSGTLMAFVERSLRANGHDVPRTDNRHAVLRAAFSTNSVQAVFNDSIGGIAIMAYQEAGNFAAGWTSTNDALNLLPHERPRMKAAADLVLHPTGGQAAHTGREANSETIQVDRYSNQCTIDENDFINDNFQLLAETPRDFGRAAARLVPALVAAILLRNPTLKRTGRALFNSTDKNLITGSPLNATNLQIARAALARMKDGDAQLNLPATHLIVPSTLGDLAITLTTSRERSNDSGQGNVNPLAARNIQAVEEARLADGTPDPQTRVPIAGSLTTHYLVSAEGRTIEVQYLAGTGQQPIVDVEQLRGTGEYGLNIAVKHFAGAAPLDCLSMIRIDA
jgi:hypothetical protein